MLALYSSLTIMRLPLFTLRACCRFEILAVESMSNMHQTNIILESSSIEDRETLFHQECFTELYDLFLISPFSCQSWVLGSLIMSQLPRKIQLLRWKKVSSSITTLNPTSLLVIRSGCRVSSPVKPEAKVDMFAPYVYICF